MKKIIALALCLMMMCGAALAETAEKETMGTLTVGGNFQIKCRIPDGYKMNILDANSTSVLAVVASEAENTPHITVSVAFNEEYTEFDEATGDSKALKLNDVSDEVMEEIKASFLDNMLDAEFEEKETAYGTKLLVVKGHVDEESSIVDFYSIYNSYEVEVIATMGQDAENGILSEEQIQMVVDFLSEMDFVAM